MTGRYEKAGKLVEWQPGDPTPLSLSTIVFKAEMRNIDASNIALTISEILVTLPVKTMTLHIDEQEKLWLLVRVVVDFLTNPDAIAEELAERLQ